MRDVTKIPMKTFFCNSCCQKQDITELANTVPVYNSDPIRTCRTCYDRYHNPPKEKKKKEFFTCVFCRDKVFSVLYRMRVNVSEPNELNLRNGKTYDFCSDCKNKVVEYNSDEDRDWEKYPAEEWE